MPERQLRDTESEKRVAREPERDEERHTQPSSFGPRQVTPSAIMQLQRTIGNAAVQRLLAREPSRALLQRRLWNNTAAKFETENDLGAPNSEYQVTDGGYRRYAPVNILRGIPDQVYYNSPNRSFVYLTGMGDDLNTPAFDALYDDGEVQSVVGGSVTFTSGRSPNSPPVVADIGPSEGAMVFDADVADDGRVTDPHVGHHVKGLGLPLPTLDDPDALLEVQRKLQSGEIQALTGAQSDRAVADAQKQKAIKSSPYI
jgi:hypothetical protein